MHSEVMSATHKVGHQGRKAGTTEIAMEVVQARLCQVGGVFIISWHPGLCTYPCDRHQRPYVSWCA